MGIERLHEQHDVGGVERVGEAHRRQLGEAGAGEADAARLAPGGTGDGRDLARGRRDARVVEAGAEAGGEVRRPEEELGDAGGRGDLGGGGEAGRRLDLQDQPAARRASGAR